MANDDPTSLRMGFGYRQARAAGLGGIRAPRSSRQVNSIIRENRANHEATEKLRAAVQNPDWIPLVEHRAAQGLTAEKIEDEIYWIERYARMRARGYSVAFCLRYHWR